MMDDKLRRGGFSVACNRRSHDSSRLQERLEGIKDATVGTAREDEDMVDVRESGPGYCPAVARTRRARGFRRFIVATSCPPHANSYFAPTTRRKGSIPPPLLNRHHKQHLSFALRKAQATLMLCSMIPLATLTLIASACLPLSQGFSWVYAPSRQGRNGGMPEPAIDGAFS